MILVKFKSLKESQIAKNAVIERVEALELKFPDLTESRITVTLEMENSPLKAGPDLFTVKLHVVRGRYDGITVTKADQNLYVALAEVVEHMLERLNRFGDRARVKERNKARKVVRRLDFMEPV
ncbi:MAG: HPF/RaiA family ribosome-associated protein [Methylotenera sp.]|nr:HPF/RaiA family ribosome-associated protein [Oligoflexia bacterium]